jgi:acetoin utilization deacetylase AcuC-like enzyme
VAIVDWDAHHGNGTQEIFYESSSVLVMSCHRHPYYPNTGSADAIGSGDGRGYNINVELQKGMGDDEMLAAFRRVFIPELVRFGPDITLVSAGFDGHRWELLGGLEMSEHGYGRVARELFGALEEIGSGRVVAVLEGGYDPEALGKCVVAVIEGVLDRPSYRVPHFEERPCRSFVSSLDRLRASVEEARRSSRLSSYPE